MLKSATWWLIVPLTPPREMDNQPSYDILLMNYLWNSLDSLDSLYYMNITPLYIEFLVFLGFLVLYEYISPIHRIPWIPCII